MVVGWSFYALITYVTDATYCGRWAERWSRWAGGLITRTLCNLHVVTGVTS